MQVNGWKASSIKRYSKFKGKKPNQKFLFTAVFKKGRKKSFIQMIMLIRLINLEKTLKKMPIGLIGIR